MLEVAVDKPGKVRLGLLVAVLLAGFGQAQAASNEHSLSAKPSPERLEVRVRAGRLDVRLQDVELVSALRALGAASGATFSIRGSLPRALVSLELQHQSLEAVLAELLRGMSYAVFPNPHGTPVTVLILAEDDGTGAGSMFGGQRAAVVESAAPIHRAGEARTADTVAPDDPQRQADAFEAAQSGLLERAIDGLQGRDQMPPFEACTALAQSSDPRAEPALVAAARTGTNPELQRMAVMALYQRSQARGYGEAATLSVFRELAGSADPTVRDLATKAVREADDMSTRASAD